MNCGEVKDLIQLYLDNELDARNTLSVQQHLDLCGACSRHLNTLLVQDQALRRAAQAETIDSSRLRAGILSAINQQMPVTTTAEKTSWLPRLPDWLKVSAWPRVTVAAALAIIIIVAVIRIGWMPGVNEAVYAAVAADHAAHCSPGEMMGAIGNPDDLKHLTSTFVRLNAVPDLSDFGYGNPQGRICKVNDVEFLHMVYYHPTQQPLSLFIRPHAPHLITEHLTALHQDRFDVVSVSQAGVDLFIVSSLDEERTSSIARAIASRL